jgi:hypothetical protein
MSHTATRRTLIALAVTLAAALPAHAIYKWVDEKGVTHFSEHPPPDGKKAQKIEPKVTPPSSDAKPADWKQREQDARKRKIEQEQKDDYQRGKAHNNAAERQNRCGFARRELHVLEKQVPVYHVNEKGEKVYLEDKDRPAQIAQWKRTIAEYCD